MKNWLGFVSVLICLLYLSGCAVIDLSSMETAVPLKPGHVDASTYMGVGLDLSSAVVIEQTEDSYYHSHDEDIAASNEMIWGFKANIGLLPGTELMLRMYGTDSYSYSGRDRWESTSDGYKAGIKLLCAHKGKKYFSIAPSVNIIKGVTEEWDYYDDYRLTNNKPVAYGYEGQSENNAKDLTAGRVEGDEYQYWKTLYNSYGYEMQLLFSSEASKYFTFSGVLRGNVNYYTENYRGIKYGPYTIYHYGARVNMMITFKPVFLIVELGSETVPVINGNRTMLPVASVGAGLRF